MKAKQILVVDDEPMICRLLSRILANQGYIVSSTPDPSKVVDLCENAPPDLVITDMCMPDMDGFDLIKQLRETFPATKILAMSGKLQESLFNLASTTGANLTCRKPFALEEFLDSVRQLVGPPLRECAF